MSTTQPELHKYFKTIKKYNDSGSKGSKQCLLTKESIGTPTCFSTFHNSGDKLIPRPNSPNKETINCTDDINLKSVEKDVCILETLSSKEEIQVPGNSRENATRFLHDAAEIDNEESILPATPKRKTEDSEGPSRKRKRQQLEEESLKLPLQTTPDEEKKSQSSFMTSEKKRASEHKTFAKKQLIMVEGISSQQGKLNPEAMKKKLGKCSHLDELRSRLLRLNQCEGKLQAFRSQAWKKNEGKTPVSPKKPVVSTRRKDLRNATSPYKVSSPCKDDKSIPSPYKFEGLHLNHFSSINIEVPVSPAKSPAKALTPVKSCHERFSHLVEPSSNQLQLPHRYQLVKEVFRAVDTVVSLLHNRQEVITFSKLKPAVQEMLRKAFSENHLGQLKTVFPLAYFFAQEKTKSKKASSYNAVFYEMTVKPNLNYKKDIPASRNLMQEMDVADSILRNKYRKMDSVVLVERRHIFHSALLDILKKHHDHFLQSLDPPIVLEGPLRRWHPDFAIEEVPPPVPSLLPQPPSGSAPKTAKDVLDKAKDIFAVNNRMKEAFASVAAASTTAPSAPQSATTTDKNEVAAALKGVSLSLLEKIRAREAVKAARQMTRSVGASRELEMLSRLPELVRLLRSLFVAEKKAALSWESVVLKVVSSHSGSLSAVEAESHLNLLMKEVPGWCTCHKVRSGIYLKIDKTRQMHEITEKLNSIIKAKT